MTIAFVLGNGISRQDIPLPTLHQQGKIYGCNALYREFTPDVLVATDRPIAGRIQETGYAEKNRFYTRRPLPGKGGHQVPTAYYGYSSGPIAVSLAALDHHERVYLLGFDLGPTEQKGFNNLYANTEFYKKSNAHPTFTGNWIRQLSQIIRDYPQIRFFRICGPSTARISELDALLNLEHMDLEVFRDRMYNQQNL
jgi:hypothetical protein